MPPPDSSLAAKRLEAMYLHREGAPISHQFSLVGSMVTANMLTESELYVYMYLIAQRDNQRKYLSQRVLVNWIGLSRTSPLH